MCKAPNVIPQPRNMAVVCLQVVCILCDTLLASLSGGERCPVLELSQSTVVGAFALVRLLLLPPSGPTARFSHLVRGWAGAGDQAGPVICLQCSRSQEARSWSHVLPAFQYDKGGQDKLSLLLSPTASSKHLASEERESAEEVTRRVGAAVTEGLELTICNRKSRVSYSCVIPIAATEGRCITCAWEYLASWSPGS